MNMLQVSPIEQYEVDTYSITLQLDWKEIS